MVWAVVLAAGASSRFGSPKQRLLVEPVLERVRASGGVDGIVVVTGAHTLEASATTVHCPEWERGPGASLRCGLAALPEGAHAAVVVCGCVVAPTRRSKNPRATLALGFVVPVMFALGALFGSLYAAAYLLGRKIEADRAAWEAGEGR